MQQTGIVLVTTQETRNVFAIRRVLYREYFLFHYTFLCYWREDVRYNSILVRRTTILLTSSTDRQLSLFPEISICAAGQACLGTRIGYTRAFLYKPHLFRFLGRLPFSASFSAGIISVGIFHLNDRDIVKC